MEIDFQASGAWKQTGAALLISEKADCKAKRDKEGHFILIKGTIQQKEVTIVNIHTECQCTQFHKADITGHKNTDPTH
jgi:GTP cyclohydrolase II